MLWPACSSFPASGTHGPRCCSRAWPPARAALLATAAPAAHALDANALRATLSREMLRGGFPFAGAYVRDLDTGTALYAHKEDVARPPASVEKLYTTSTALLRFGAATRFHTQVVATGTLDSQGVWRGDLYLRGAGDPTLGQAADRHARADDRRARAGSTASPDRSWATSPSSTASAARRARATRSTATSWAS